MVAKRRLVVGTGNPGKIRELANALSTARIEPVNISDLVSDFDPVEDGTTFLENARIKAVAAVAASGLPACADDSGLCVVGLNLEPGINSARYAGPGKSDTQRIHYLLQQMQSLFGDARESYFTCALSAFVPREWLSKAGHRVATPSPWPGLVELSTEAHLHGHIGTTLAGNDGFGYDPVFRPAGGGGRTLAQYSLEEKNRISHRGQALAQLRRLMAAT